MFCFLAQANEALASLKTKHAGYRRLDDLVGGETGIRTLDPLARITVFETAPIGRSGISPW